MDEQPKNIRQKLLWLLESYWWVILILVIILTFTTDISLFKWLLWGAGAIVALLIFSPFLFQLFAPAIFLISELSQHFQESKGQTPAKRYFFIPASLVAAGGFITAQTILSIWVIILSALIWASVIGFILTFVAMFFFALAPIATLTAPFVVWYQGGIC